MSNQRKSKYVLTWTPQEPSRRAPCPKCKSALLEGLYELGGVEYIEAEKCSNPDCDFYFSFEEDL